MNALKEGSSIVCHINSHVKNIIYTQSTTKYHNNMHLNTVVDSDLIKKYNNNSRNLGINAVKNTV
jgi:hypothetical protein